jgi:hypothetical protein
MLTHPWQFLPTRYSFGACWAPLMHLALRGPDGRVRLVWFILDTGAVVSLMQNSVALALGLNVAAGKREQILGVGGGRFPAYLHDIRVEVDRRDLLIPMAIAETDNVPNLLGRHGVIDRISIRLDHRKKTTTLARRL